MACAGVAAIAVPTLAFASDDPPFTASVVAHDNWFQVTVSPDEPGDVARVTFYLGTRRVCTVTAPPFSCAVKPTGADVGAQTLRFVVTGRDGQSSESTRTINVNRFKVRRLRLVGDRLRSGATSRTYRISGRLDLPVAVTVAQGCRSGHVTLALKRGAATLANQQVALKRDCTFAKSVRVARRGKFTVVARFGGNTVLQAANAKGRLS